MAYDDLVDRLDAGDAAPSVAAFPDGSVDTRYEVRESSASRLASRERFGDLVGRGDRDSFQLERRARRAGGQAVNVARQAHALGDPVCLAGHLDDPAFGDLPVDAHSMGDPADVTVLEFAEGDLMLAEESRDIRSWDVADLRSALPGGVPVLLDADVVCCLNWVSFPNMADVLAAVADAAADADDRGPFVVDPGDLSGSSPDAVDAFLDALAALDESFAVSVSVDAAELARLADHVGRPDGTPRAQVAAVREAAGVGAVVRHATGAAVAATAGGTARVRNVDVEAPVTDAGAGDCFTGGFAHAVGAGWPLETALALGNVCASHFVATAEAGDAAALRERAVDPPFR